MRNIKTISRLLIAYTVIFSALRLFGLTAMSWWLILLPIGIPLLAYAVVKIASVNLNPNEE